MYLYLLIVFLGDSFAKDCPKPFSLLEREQICVQVQERLLDRKDMEGYCQSINANSRPYLRKVSDNMLQDLTDMLGYKVEVGSAALVFTGMRKDSGFGSKTWQYSVGDESVEEDDYPLWIKKPNFGDDCGAIMYQKDFLVAPYSCGKNAALICEKEKGTECHSDAMRYVNYYGLCLSVVAKEDSYDLMTKFCMDGHAFPYKNDKQTDSVAAAILNMQLDGGIYTGLKREPNGRWIYEEDGLEEHRWDAHVPQETDCGIISFVRGMTFDFFAMKCEDGMRIICEYDGKFQKSLV
ncbi:uncharacterized protein LOC129216661 [Uloborus diversus]|uniref:uncharacterized protein LOC129216661 n=1 Tax=Uloborus diversus TaxID=327109 RepID=UPI0024097A20|nr:uncharacterized protein LOC129216661 [Uloborus diversus]